MIRIHGGIKSTHTFDLIAVLVYSEEMLLIKQLLLMTPSLYISKRLNAGIKTKRETPLTFPKPNSLIMIVSGGSRQKRRND